MTKVNKLIFVCIGFLLAAIILSLLTLSVRARRSKLAAVADQEQMKSKPIAQPETHLVKETEQGPEKAVPSAAPLPVATPSRSLGEVIQHGFEFFAEGAYDQAISSFQEGLRMTDDSKVAVQLHLELAKIHNILSEQDEALQDLNSALEFCRKSENGIAEKEILQIKQMITSQKKAEA